MRLPPTLAVWPLRPLLALQRRRYGAVLEPTALWSHRPRALLAFLALFGALRGRRSPLSAGLRSLVSLRVSQLTGCAFCVDMNASLLAEAGISEDKALALTNWRNAAEFDAGERLALEYAEAVTATPPAVDDELFARLRSRFSPEAIVELTAVISFQNLSARFNAALDAEPHGFCALPVPTALSSTARRSSSQPECASGAPAQSEKRRDQDEGQGSDCGEHDRHGRISPHGAP